jgi:branched-chain amino acid transport system permease protein
MVTFAHGEVMVVGTFTSFFTFLMFGNNIFLGLIASFSVTWLLGIVIFKVCNERFFNAPQHISLMCTIGASMLIMNLAQIIFGPNIRPMLNVVPTRFFQFGVVQISIMQIVIILTVVILAILLTLLFKKTKFGLQLKAVSQNKDAAYLMGVNVKRVAMVGTCLGCALGGVAGMLLGIYYQMVLATMGGSVMMKAISAGVVGGLTDVRFSAFGGVIIGIIENLGIAATTASLRDVFAFIFLILVLYIRPQGFSKKHRVKV